MLEFRILGPVEVRHDGRIVELRGPRPRAVLAVLLVHAGQPVAADVLVQALWGEEAAATAVNALQVSVSRLRRALGDAAARVETAGGGYRLHVEEGELDAQRFERAYERARGMPPREAATTLGEALALWRGPPLADLRYEPWAQAEIRRLEELRAAAVEERVEADLAVGEHGRLVGELEALVAEHPLRERLRAQQMLALYRSGRHADALGAFRAAREALSAELGLEPGPELRQLEQAILTHDPSLVAPEAAARAVPPVPPTPTFGREADVREVLALLERARLLTLTGTGGVGKTRLAVEVARAAGGRFVSLASTADADRIPAVICDALAVARIPGETDADALDRALGRGPLLLVVDNLEHLPDAAPLLAALLERHQGLRLLATSRQPVGIHAERLYPVRPLTVDSDTSPALALFVDRARARDPSFAVTDANRAAVVAVCERLGGLPLAIELAAARLGVLTPAGLAARVSDALAVLDQGPRDALERQQTLRGTLDWSFDLLEEAARDAFSALGAFAGGCELDAAEAVTGTGLPVLEALVAKSLVTVKDGRLTLLEPIRQYAAERLAARPDAHAVHARHLAHYTALAERYEDQIWVRQRSCPEFAALRREHDNLRAAVKWGLESGEAHGVLELVSAVGHYMWSAREPAELRGWWQRAFADAGPDLPVRIRARAYLARGNNAADVADRYEHTRVALDLLRPTGDDLLIARGLNDLAVFANLDGDFAGARGLADEALVHGRRIGNDALIGVALGELSRATRDSAAALRFAREAATHLRTAGALGRLAQMLSALVFSALGEDAYARAAQLAREALDAALATADPYTVAFVHGNLGLAALLAGEHGAARTSFREELMTAHAHHLVQFYSEGLLGLAALAATGGDDHRAAVLDAAAWALSDRPVAPGEKQIYARVQQRVAPVRARLGEEAWQSAQAAGQAMTADAAMAYALEASPVAGAQVPH